MSDEELKELGRKYHLRGFIEEGLVLTDDRKIVNDFVINRKDVIDQLSQRDTRRIAYYSMILSVILSVATILISLIFK
jgi:hypothetical protein